MMDLSVLIVNYNSWRECVGAVNSLREHPPSGGDGQPLSCEVIIIDNCSSLRDDQAEAELAEILAETGWELVMHHENGGYSKGMNLAYERASGRYLLVSNPDVIFQPDCVDALIRHMEEDPGCGAAAPLGYWDKGLDGRLPPNILPTLSDLWATTLVGLSPRSVARYSDRRTREALRVWEAQESIDLPMLSGACFLMKREHVEAIGFFDPRFPLYYEDTDLSVRIRKHGLRIVQVSEAAIVHLYNRSGQTSGEETLRRYWISRHRYYRKWYGVLGGWLHSFSRWILGSRLGCRLARRAPQPDLIDIPTSTGKPVIKMPRDLDRFLVEISLDPRFYLAAGTFGKGDRWTPSDHLYANFGPTTYYFRVCDLSNGRPRQIGVYRFKREFLEEWRAAALAGIERRGDDST